MRNFNPLLIFVAITLSSCWHEGSCRKSFCVYQGKLCTKAKTYNFPEGKKLHMTTFIVKPTSPGYGETVYLKVYNQHLPDGSYKKIGKKGFVTLKNGQYAIYDSTSKIPDGIVIQSFDKDTQKQYYIYKDGKPQLYTGKVMEGYSP